jgi:DNA replication ATP-dependent helicase Dna2
LNFHIQPLIIKLLQADFCDFQGLPDSNNSDYSYEHRRKKRFGHVVGMTIWGAITYLGLHRHSHFRPYIALVDEASLMPLSYASILGKCASSICLFGDSRQMSPIFRSELADNRNSISILDYSASSVKGVPVKVLHTTFRMNKEITALVSRNFYEPYGHQLISADSVKDRRLDLPYFRLMGWNDSITWVKCDADGDDETRLPTEENEMEANVAIDIICGMMKDGVSPDAMAIITPFRRQVRLLRDIASEKIGNIQPLIDTVERLQGQDVDCIILSFAAANPKFIDEHEAFLFNPNRLNVMFSRAKKKVIIVGSNVMVDRLQKLVLI